MPVIFGVKNFLKLSHIIQLLRMMGKIIGCTVDLHRYPLTHKRQFTQQPNQ